MKSAFDLLRPIIQLSISAALLSSLSGCGSDPEESSSAATPCEGFETAFDSYSAGLEKAGNGNLFSLRLMDATPAPPGQGDNAWTLQALDATSIPTNNATITKIEPFMPDHGHGTSTAPSHNWTGEDGMVDVTNIDFMMPGVWEVRFDLESSDGETDRVVFSFCVEG